MSMEKKLGKSNKAESALIKGDSEETLRYSLMLTMYENTEYSHYRIVNNNELQFDSFYSMQPYNGYLKLPFKLKRENIFDFVLNWYNQIDFDKIDTVHTGGDGSEGIGFVVESKDFGAEYSVSIKAIKVYYGK